MVGVSHRYHGCAAGPQLAQESLSQSNALYVDAVGVQLGGALFHNEW